MRRNRVEHYQGHDLDDRFPSGSRSVDAFCADLARPSQFDPARIETLAAELAAEASASASPNQHGAEFGRRRRPLPTRWRRRAALTALMSSMIAKVAFATVAVATTGGLAATGNLPDPAQRIVSEVANRIGINVPTPSTTLPVPLPPAAPPTPAGPPTPADPPTPTDRDTPQPGQPTLPEQASERSKWVLESVHDEDAEVARGPEFGKRVSETASEGSARGGASDGNRPEGRGRPENPGPPDGVGNRPPGPPGRPTP